MLQKTILRIVVKETLLEFMEQGILKSGQRISIPQLSNKLDISATPLREALTQLTETGLVTYIVNRGFFVPETIESEALELYELIAILESQSILNSTYTNMALKELEVINIQFRNSQDSFTKLKSDKLFHQKLIENFSNNHAKKIIEDLRTRILMYEYEFMATSEINESVKMH